MVEEAVDPRDNIVLASMQVGIPPVQDIGWAVLARLRTCVQSVINDYQSLEQENVEAGGEEGSIIINRVDDNIMATLECIREAFKSGLKPKAGFFGSAAEPRALIELLSEITLKSAFQELLSLPETVDRMFESDPKHMEMAWIIMAINDVAVPQYIEIIRQNPELASKYFNQKDGILMQDDKATELLSIIHALEVVYFDLDYYSYADACRAQHAFSVASPSLQSVNRSISSLKLNGSTDQLSLPMISLSPQPESNNSEIPTTPSNVTPSIGDSKSLRSTHSTAPRKSSPLKDSVSAAEETDAEDEVEHEYIDQENILESVSEEDEDKDELSVTSETVTTPESFATTETTLTTITSASIRSSESSQRSRQGPFGLNLPKLFHNQPSILTSTIGIITNPFLHERKPVSAAIPGDFEAIDREEEVKRAQGLGSEEPVELQICPVKGLNEQRFKCQQCKETIGIGDYPEAKLCDISGYYFCGTCHVDDLSLSPARVLRNWDFHKVPVSKRMYTVVGFQCRSELFIVEDINPDLFLYVNELQNAKNLRKQLLSYSSVFLCCKNEEHMEIYQRVWPREHLIDSADKYTIEDLFEASKGTLAAELSEYLELIKQHVTQNCIECKSRFNLEQS